MRKTKRAEKKHKGLKVLLICIAGLIILAAGLLLTVMLKPQIMTSALQMEERRKRRPQLSC